MNRPSGSLPSTAAATATAAATGMAVVLSAVTALTAACGSADWTGGADQDGVAEPLARGEPTPAAFGFGGDRPGVALVIRPEDCVSCVLAEPARELRAVQRQTGGRVQFLTVVVTERPGEDRRTVEDFLDAERVESAVATWTPEEHREVVGDAPLPSVYVTHRGRVVEVVDERTTTRMRLMAQGKSLTEVLTELLEEGRETDDAQADDDHADDTASTNPGGIP